MGKTAVKGGSDQTLADFAAKHVCASPKINACAGQDEFGSPSRMSVSIRRGEDNGIAREYAITAGGITAISYLEGNGWIASVTHRIGFDGAKKGVLGRCVKVEAHVEKKPRFAEPLDAQPMNWDPEGLVRMMAPERIKEVEEEARALARTAEVARFLSQIGVE